MLQETFIAAWRSAGSFAGVGSVRSWLLSIARNVHRHHRRRRVDAPTTFVSLDVLAERAGWGCDPAEARRVDLALARDVLAHALGALPHEEREILVLRELEGLSGDETAAVLQLTLPAMKSRLHRARLHLGRSCVIWNTLTRHPGELMSAPDAGLDTIVAGIRCRDVLLDLSDYLDGVLAAARVTELQAHLSGCDRCARFGGEVSQTIAALRTALQVPDAIDGQRAIGLRESFRRVQSA